MHYAHFRDPGIFAGSCAVEADGKAERYLCLAATWASDPSWNEKPEAVEYALFKHGQKPRRRRT
jgi:hypothetical protein